MQGTLFGFPLDFVYQIHPHVSRLWLIAVMSMNSISSRKPGNRLWGIYHTDREYARELGDPLRTTIEAPTKIAAEEAAAHLGFSDPWAHPVDSENQKQGHGIDEQKPPQRTGNKRKHSRGISV
jgi:hypothetical protein